jgi:ubiquinone/menaquinone biosynthesis C-methylase UbiE
MTTVVDVDGKMKKNKTHTCPWWLGIFLANPLRKLIENPADLVLPLVKPGDCVLELGPAMGFFSLPVASSVGPDGKLVCVELQSSMLASLRKRLRKRGLMERCELRQCSSDDLGVSDLDGKVALALAIHVVHETARPTETIEALARTLKPGGRILLIEPVGHCSAALFKEEVTALQKCGLRKLDHPVAKVNGRQQCCVWENPSF